jgi:multidrug efflux system outer membrane protein
VDELLPEAPLPRLPEEVHLGDIAGFLRRRPDVRAAERDLAAATARVGVATADLYPRVSFVGSLGIQADAFSGLTAAGSGATSFGPRITWAAFDLGRVRQRVVAADARAVATLARFEQTVLLALEEIDSALVTYGRELEQAARLRESAAASERATELARLRYQDGVSDFLTVLDAERRLLESQDTLARSETRAAVALVAVFKALAAHP